MSVDYGSRRLRRTRGQQAVVLAAAGTAVAFTGWMLGGAYLKHRREALSFRDGWVVDGPPCPEVTREAFAAQGLTAPKGVNYAGVRFYRRFGHVECSELRRGSGWSGATDPACQFTSPGALRVTTARGDWYFAPGAGRPATIYTDRGQARCVLASGFTLAPARGR